MKDKLGLKNSKTIVSVSIIIAISIILVLFTLLVVDTFKELKKDDYKEVLEQAACTYADDSNITEGICEAFSSTCRVTTEVLISGKYVSASLDNPMTKDRNDTVKDDTSYVQIEYKDNERTCKYTQKES